MRLYICNNHMHARTRSHTSHVKKEDEHEIKYAHEGKKYVRSCNIF